MIERFYGARAARAATVFVALCGGLILLAFAFQLAILPLTRAVVEFIDEPTRDQALRSLKNAAVATAVALPLTYGAITLVSRWGMRKLVRVRADLDEAGAAGRALLVEISAAARAAMGLRVQAEMFVRGMEADVNVEEWMVNGALPGEVETIRDVLRVHHDWERRWEKLVAGLVR